MECGGGRGGGGGGGGYVLVEARLQGGAPWGFTVQGGLEHGEPLIISKVEDGGKADTVERPLLVGDEILIINDVELTGFRQEAVALVKGSHKTLTITVRREFNAGEPYSSPPSLPPPSPPPLSPRQQHQQQSPVSSHNRRRCSASGVQLRIKNRRSEPTSRPHSWHSTKLGEDQRQLDQDDMGTMSSNWHHSYHQSSASTTNLSSGFDSSAGYLRKSPDQYSSRGSMESLDPPQSSHLHSGGQHHHTLGHHSHGGPHPAYSSCHQLSSARSSNSIDHLHSKRDSAYSSFSTSSSIPEYLASTPSFSPERSYSLEAVSQRGGESSEMQQTDIHYIQTVYDAKKGLSQEHELSSSSTALLRNNILKGGGGSKSGQGRDLQGVCYRGSSSSSGSSSGGAPASNRHSVGPIWGPSASCSSYESLKGVPAPPQRSDSYTAIRNHERPNSWSSLEQARSLRSLQKGSWHHSSGPVASGATKGSYGTEGLLHTVIEKSPESSPTTKPRQGGGFLQPPSPPECPSGSAGPAPQSGRVILPTVVYPVLQPEPHYAQMPGSNPGSGSSTVYPALAKENSQRQFHESQGSGQRNEGMLSASVNGQQNNISSLQYPHSYAPPASSQLRAQTHETDRLNQEESNRRHNRPHMDSDGDRAEGQTRVQRPQNHQEPHSQCFHGSHTHKGHGPHDQMFQEQNHGFQIPQIHSTPGLRSSSSHEWRDPYIPVQSRDRSRSVDHTAIHTNPVAFSRPAQGQVPPAHSLVHPQPHAPPTSATQSSPHHLNDSVPLQYQHWDHRDQDNDREHPLTRLENALAEVQRCASSDSVISASSRGSSNFDDGSQIPTRSLSVLEKVSRFERREQAGKKRSYSTSHTNNKATHLRTNDKGRSSPCGADDLRNMLERSTNSTKPRRTMSYRGSSNDYMKFRTPVDPSSALQRSRSTFQLEESRECINNRDVPHTQDIQEVLGSMQATSFNRSYRDSLKDAQNKVLRSTSFKRRDFSSSSSSPPAAPPPVSSSNSQQPPPVPAKHHSREKKGPKTKPKPQGIIIGPQSPPPITSPHTPKERHVVTPEVRGPSPPTLPTVPPVGPPALVRICGRKRLMAEQKKRSYSEPENLNEVGVSDAETAALFRRGGETSVADRRKMFELAASRVGGGAPQNATSRPELRQLQHDALAEYVERKRGGKREDGGQRSGPRPRSAYLQPDNSNHPGRDSCSYSETFSLSSASSLLSLQDSGPERTFPVEKRSCSTLPPGADLRSYQSNLFYPGRVTTPRPPAQPAQSAALPSSSPELQTKIFQDLSPEASLRRQSQSVSRDSGLDQQQDQDREDNPFRLGLSRKLNGALQRAGSNRSSGKSTSAEDLLERPVEKHMTPQHFRSRSSPTMETLQDFSAGDVGTFGVFVSEPGCCALPEDRPADTQVLGNLTCPQLSDVSVNSMQPSGSCPDPGSSSPSSSSFTPVTRRERQRNGERPRANSTSTLAASVGLPCPFSPPGPQGGGGSEWQPSERLSMANLEAITFPGTGTSDVFRETLEANSQMRLTLSDTGHLGDTEEDMHRGTAEGLDMRGQHVLENNRILPSEMLSPLPHFQLSPPPNTDNENTVSPPSPLFHLSTRHLSSLRISESSLLSHSDQENMVTSMGRSQEDFDEVFLQSPAISSPPPPIKETSIVDNFPPPPPPIELDTEPGYHSAESPSSELLTNSRVPTRKPSLPSPPLSPSSSVLPPPVPPLSTINTPTTAEDSFGLEYQPLPKREKTPEEQRVETLARKLVLQDSSLLPLLDTWGTKSTIELMSEIFPHSRLVDRSQWQHRGSERLDDRIEDCVCDSASEVMTETDEKDVNTRKVELCEALRSSMEALQQEKELLCEEQQRHQELGVDVERLVQEKLKPNEKDKYSVFIGDLERIVSLLLSLCSRLSRIDRSLLAVDTEELTQEDAAEEKESLHRKRTLLLRQTEDAWELKENLDRRQRVVQSILSGYLTEVQLQDYRHFVSAKPSLLIRRRHLDDLIRQEGEQLKQLVESLPADVEQAHGLSKAGPFSLPNPVACSSSIPPLLSQSVTPGPAHPVRSTTVTSL